MRTLLLSLSLVVSLACGARSDFGDPNYGSGESDGGLDAARDADVLDSSVSDSGPTDTGQIDGSPRDTGSADSAPLDASPADGGSFDSGPADSGMNDAGPDATPDTGPDGSVGDHCPLDDPFGFGDDDDDTLCSPGCFGPTRDLAPCESADTFVSGTVLEDTVWEGRVCVEGLFGVRTGVTLTVTAGTEVYFRRGASLELEGHMDVEGTPDAPVLFSSNELEPKVGDWGGIALQLTNGGTMRMQHAIVEYGNIGVATWESTLTVEGPETDLFIEHSLFQFNNTAMTPDDNSEVRFNTVACNRQGIFVASEDVPVQRLADNNICQNLEWGMSAQQSSADGTDNYWCTVDAAEIDEIIDDERDSIRRGGLIEYVPFRTEPVPEAPDHPAL